MRMGVGNPSDRYGGPSDAAPPPPIVPRPGRLPAPPVPAGRRPAVHRRPHRRRHRGRAGRRRRLAGPDLLPAGHPVGLPRAGPQRRPPRPRRRRPPERPPRRPGARAVLGPDRRVRPGPPAAPRGVLRRGRPRAGRALDAGADKGWLWKRRRVYVSDGSSVTRPDTPANQAEYPQPVAQKPGLGFPLARIGAAFSRACGAVVGLGICRYAGKGQSDLGVLRTLLDLFRPGDVMLADRLMCAWTEMVMLKQRGVDSVCRLSSHRTADFRRGRRLGAGDHVVEWPKPPKPRAIDREADAALPASLTVRECRVRVAQPGFRTRALVIATTLPDAKEYAKDDLGQLCRARWSAELDLRSLKQTLPMDVLRCKTPELVRKGLWAHILADNRIRTAVAQAAARHGVAPRSISFKGAAQTPGAFQPVLALRGEGDAAFREAVYARLLDATASHRVGDRPGRYEPRRRKRRPKPYDRLMKPRHEAKRAMRKGVPGM